MNTEHGKRARARPLNDRRKDLAQADLTTWGDRHEVTKRLAVYFWRQEMGMGVELSRQESLSRGDMELKDHLIVGTGWNVGEEVEEEDKVKVEDGVKVEDEVMVDDEVMVEGEESKDECEIIGEKLF